MVNRDEQGRLVIVEMVDGVETVVKVIPKHEEQLYLRRQGNNDFPAKAEFDKVQEMERPYDVHVHMDGGAVKRFDEVEKDLPDHPECRVPETLRQPRIVEGVEGEGEEAEYSLLGVNLDPGENPEDEPVEEQK